MSWTTSLAWTRTWMNTSLLSLLRRQALWSRNGRCVRTRAATRRRCCLRANSRMALACGRSKEPAATAPALLAISSAAARRCSRPAAYRGRSGACAARTTPWTPCGPLVRRSQATRSPFLGAANGTTTRRVLVHIDRLLDCGAHRRECFGGSREPGARGGVFHRRSDLRKLIGRIEQACEGHPPQADLRGVSSMEHASLRHGRRDQQRSTTNCNRAGGQPCTGRSGSAFSRRS